MVSQLLGRGYFLAREPAARRQPMSASKKHAVAVRLMQKFNFVFRGCSLGRSDCVDGVLCSLADFGASNEAPD